MADQTDRRGTKKKETFTQYSFACAIHPEWYACLNRRATMRRFDCKYFGSYKLKGVNISTESNKIPIRLSMTKHCYFRNQSIRSGVRGGGVQGFEILILRSATQISRNISFVIIIAQHMPHTNISNLYSLNSKLFWYFGHFQRTSYLI